MNRLDNEMTQFRIKNAGHLAGRIAGQYAGTERPADQHLAAVNEAINGIAEEKMTLETNLNTLKTQRDTIRQPWRRRRRKERSTAFKMSA